MTITNYAAIQEMVLDVIDNSLPANLEGLSSSARRALDTYALRLGVTPNSALSIARAEAATAVAQARRLTQIADEAYRRPRPGFHPWSLEDPPRSRRREERWLATNCPHRQTVDA